MKLRIYLDTSVFSAYDDERAPERLAETKEFWSRLDGYDVSTSDLAVAELRQTAGSEKRARLEALLSGVTVHSVTDEMRALARRYVDGGVFSESMYNDALHVAAAVLTGQDILLSWNFRHLVNRRRRAQVNEINTLSGLPTVEIVAPPEL
jgi:predicted nucleic acid-binding protein